MALLLLLCGGTAGETAPGDRAGKMSPVVVTATPLPTEGEDLGRAVELIGPGEIRDSGSTSIPELLETTSSVTVEERGTGAVQADISLRGSTFQQVLTTFDGLPLSDPQTAHHNMDLPFPFDAIEQVTVIPGPGSALFGPSAFAGVVDLAPRRPTSSGARASSSLGEFATRRVAAAADLVRRGSATTLAAAHERSDGFRDGTDYETWSAWASSTLEFDAGAVRLSLGRAEKDFGAQDFYAPFPSRELTTATLVDLAPQFEPAPDWLLKAIIRYRRHEDEFILIEDTPSFYRNEHLSEVFTERLTLSSPAHTWGTTAVGLERTDAALESSNLGERAAATSSAFVQHRLPWQVCRTEIGLRLDDHDDWGAELSPSLSLSARLGERLTWRGSLARGIRPPSFTELYYVDPGNIGNAGLDPEEAWGGETGLDIRCGRAVRASVTGFVRETEDLIDWVRSSPTEPWSATNVGKATFYGGEARLAGHAPLCDWEVSYRYTDLEGGVGGLESKYALDPARHDLHGSLGLRETCGFFATVGTRYRHVPARDDYWLMTARLGRRIGRCSIFVGGSNLLDQEYEEMPGVPTAPRHLEFGIAVAL